ncbi:MAG: hypothetical protein ABII02_03195 [Candidatus Magasanikbacteria bacterium]
MQIIPSILIQTKEEFLTQIKALSSILSMIQLDIADGKFVEETTWADPDVVFEKLKIDCELHLMVKNPLEEIQLWVNVSQVKRVLVHYESSPGSMTDTLERIHSYGWEVGLVLNPDTPVDILDEVRESIDTCMLMGVKPGLQGQIFMPEVLEKAKIIKEKYPDLPLALDGGVSEETLPDIIKAGFDIVCPGSAIFGNDREPRENVKRMKKLIEKNK